MSISKDLLTTIIGGVLAAGLAAKEYIASNSLVDLGLNFWVGIAGAVGVAVFGYWSKKGE